MGFRWNIGQFLLYLGVIALLVFFITDQQQSPEYPFFCSGILLLIGGIGLMWRDRGKPQPSGRFALFRKMGEKGEKNSTARRGTQQDMEREKGKEA